MLRHITYSVTFPSTGRTLSANLALGPGFWAITGPNESGKSMVFEVARWLLFGTDALRGKADDYKTLKGSGEFIIRENVIEIERTTRGATMKRNGVVVATGTKPVNGKVVEELGFGLAVFDIACSINQGEVEKLGDMKPTARKAMIDSVLGLSALDLVAKWAAEEARLLDRQADGLKERLTPPGVAPEQPQGYLPSSSVRTRHEANTREAQELAGLEGWLANPRPKPEKPTTKVDLPAVNLESLAEKRRVAREEIAQLQARYDALPATAPFSADLLDQVEAAWAAWHAYDEEVRWARDNAPPSVPMHELHQMAVAWGERDDWARYDQQEAEVERLRAALEAVDKVTCPECEHSFALHAEHAARLGAELELAEQGVSDMRPTHDRPEEPQLKSAEISRLLQIWENLDAERWDRYCAASENPPVKPELAERDIPTYRRMIEQVAERGKIEGPLKLKTAQFGQMADYEAMLAERRQYEAALVTWQAASREYEEWLKLREEKTRRKAELAGAVEAAQKSAAELEAALAYEAAVTRHTETASAYAEGVRVIGEIEEQAAEHRKVREVMAVLRGLIKQHVIPSLNVVSSQLLRQMTGGQRNLIYIDDDFNVRVDQQDLDTLSGSGKACANLALRIALGQVLTNRVMSIMLADEIDASMDAFRAEQTSDVLRMLEERVSQVLLVSHKPVDAPHHVRLGGFSADEDDQPGGFA